MRILVALAGVVIVLFTFVDVLYTTIMSRGSGSFSDRLTSVLWQKIMARRRSWGDSRLSQAGIAVMIVVITMWIALMWAGWTLVFCGGEGAIVNAQSKAPATTWERAYFTGYTLVTLGLGDFQPTSWLWRLCTVLASLSGLFVITFSITYLVPVLQAAAERRSLAVYLSGMGLTSEEIIRNMWEEERCEALEAHLVPLAPALTLLAQRHLTYPVLQYFHGARRREALAPSIAALDEALTVLESGFEDACVSAGVMHSARAAIAELLDTLDKRFIGPEEEPPPAPALTAYREAGRSMRSDKDFAEVLEEHAARRALLLAMVRREGWSWDDICEPQEGRPEPSTVEAGQEEGQGQERKPA